MKIMQNSIELTVREKNAIKLIDSMFDTLCADDDRECADCPLKEICEKIGFGGGSYITQILKDMIPK